MKEVIDTVSVAFGKWRYGECWQCRDAGGQPYVALGRCG